MRETTQREAMLKEGPKKETSEAARDQAQHDEMLAGADAWFNEYERGHGPQGSVLDSLRYFMRVFDEAPAPYIITDKNFTITNANNAAQRLFGLRVSRLKGMPLVTLIAESDRDTFHRIITNAVQEGRDTTNRPLRLQIASGQAEVPFSASVLRDQEDSPECICWIFHDRHLAGSDDIL